MKTKIKPKRDFATETRLFLAGRYYLVETTQAQEWHKQGKVWMQKIWFERNIKCTQFV